MRRQAIRLRLTGPIALDHEEFDSVQAGGITAGIISLCLVTILLIVGLRSVWLVLATVATLLIGLIWTAAFAMLAVGHLNIISVAFAVLFVGLGVDFGIHFALRAQEACAGGNDKTAGLRDAARGVAGALALSALCAAAGFFAFLPTNYKGLAELGLIAGTGMFFALLANLTLLPALLRLLPIARPPATGRGRPRGNPIDWLVRNYSGVILAIASVLAAAGLLAAAFARFDFNPLNLKDPEQPLGRDAARARARSDEFPLYHRHSGPEPGGRQGDRIGALRQTGGRPGLVAGKSRAD